MYFHELYRLDLVKKLFDNIFESYFDSPSDTHLHEKDFHPENRKFEKTTAYFSSKADFIDDN
jgi:hypothetical protein